MTEKHPLAGSPSAGNLSRRRRVLFSIAALLIPVLVLTGIEGFLRLLEDDTEVLFEQVEGQPGFLLANPEYFQRYFGDSFIPSLAFTPFLEQKSETTFRVVALGGSSTVGYPYDDYMSFPARLEQRLVERLPARHVEVINLGATACNSYTLLDIVDDVATLEPDAVVIYAGHNEYYGALGAGSGTADFLNHAWLKRLVLKLKDVRMVQFLEEVLVPKNGNGEGATMMERVAQDRAIEFGGLVYDRGIVQFRSNMSRIVGRLKREGIPVFVGTLASNVKDQSPLGDLEAAHHTYQQAHDRWQAADTLGAREDFILAKDLDPVRFRAPSEMNEILKGIDITGLVDIDRLSCETSASTIPDQSFFTDHLHPNALANRLIAHAFYREMNRHFGADWPVGEETDVILPGLPEVSRLDHKLAELQVYGLKLGYPFRKDTSPAEQIRLLNIKLDSLRLSTYEIDQLGHAVMSSNMETPEAMRQAFLMSLSRRDTVQAILHLESMVKMSPFDREQLQQARRVSDSLSMSPVYGSLARRLGRTVINLQKGLDKGQER